MKRFKDLTDAWVVADTQGNHSRITTIAGVIPVRAWPQVLTHRTLCRNGESTRAIPVKRMIHKAVREPAVMPDWGANQKGMVAKATQAHPLLNNLVWHAGRWVTILQAMGHLKLGVHKEKANKLLSPYVYMKVILTATDRYEIPRGNELPPEEINPWDAFFGLRCKPDVMPETRIFAERVRAAYHCSTPKGGKVHTPYVERNAVTDTRRALWVSAMRVARISYNPPGGVARDPAADYKRAQELFEAKHLSPFEAPAIEAEGQWGPLYGWKPARYM